MNDFFKSLGEAVKEQIRRMDYWRFFLLMVALIFSFTVAHHFFP